MSLSVLLTVWSLVACGADTPEPKSAQSGVITYKALCGATPSCGAEGQDYAIAYAPQDRARTPVGDPKDKFGLYLDPNVLAKSPTVCASAPKTLAFTEGLKETLTVQSSEEETKAFNAAFAGGLDKDFGEAAKVNAGVSAAIASAKEAATTGKHQYTLTRYTLSPASFEELQKACPQDKHKRLVRSIVIATVAGDSLEKAKTAFETKIKADASAESAVLANTVGLQPATVGMANNSTAKAELSIQRATSEFRFVVSYGFDKP